MLQVRTATLRHFRSRTRENFLKPPVESGLELTHYKCVICGFWGTCTRPGSLFCFDPRSRNISRQQHHSRVELMYIILKSKKSRVYNYVQHNISARQILQYPLLKSKKQCLALRSAPTARARGSGFSKIHNFRRWTRFPHHNHAKNMNCGSLFFKVPLFPKIQKFIFLRKLQKQPETFQINKHCFRSNLSKQFNLRQHLERVWICEPAVVYARVL